MKLVVISCWNYRDAWGPFFQLLSKFWPTHPRPAVLLTDRAGDREVPGVNIVCGPRWHVRPTWCEVLAAYARTEQEPILLFQEDFFLTAPVRQDLVAYGLKLLTTQTAGCVRLYPSPGASEDCGDPYFGLVPKGTPNRISCQAAIWQPDYLYDVAIHSMSTTGEAGDFENLGTPYSDWLARPVYAFKREVKPWPLEYLSSAITRGQWNPDAIRLCAEYGLDLDRSMRPVLA